MDLLKGPIREGSRGGRDFKWSDVKDSKDREYYLGVSVKAPTGRWQQNRDIQWYSRDNKNGNNEDQAAAERERRLEEIRKIKEAENDALSAALGYKVVRRVEGGGLSQGEVDRAIKEAGAGGDEREEDGNEKGIGFGRIGLAAFGAGGGGDREVMAGNAKDDSEPKWRPAPPRESDKRGDRDDKRKGEDRDKSSRHRHRSRSREKGRERHQRHRSRSRSRDRERRRESYRQRRDQSRSPRRHDDRRDRRDHDRRDRDRDERRRRYD
ncbi:hypothetical protein TWF281_008782 [Arthrobotrys megalospora]